SSRRRHTRFSRDWSSDVCSSDLFRDLGLLNSLWGLTLAYTTFAVPFSAWMLRGYFNTISLELDEAAMVDGCTRFGAFFRVILPRSEERRVGKECRARWVAMAART